MTEQKTNTVGRPQRYDEVTKVIAFRIPLSAEVSIRELVNQFLIKLEK